MFNGPLTLDLFRNLARLGMFGSRPYHADLKTRLFFQGYNFDLSVVLYRPL
jgi:hypothetical protein